MNESSDLERLERLESLKAGLIAGFSLLTAFIIAIFLHVFLANSLGALGSLRLQQMNLNWVVSMAIAFFSGFLFGVTYRYIVRSDRNLQLKAGAVLAFGLVRGLAQVDVGLNFVGSFLPFVVLSVESILFFAIAAIGLDWAMHRSWIKPFKSD